VTLLHGQRPVVVALTGPNGAGKTTFYHAHLKGAGLRLVNADTLARAAGMDAYAAARAAAVVRNELVRQGESFVFETVFSDPVGEKVEFLREVRQVGYLTVLCFIGISGPEVSEERVAMRVSQGGHDVPSDKLTARFPRTMANLRLALEVVDEAWVFDNSDLRHPYRKVAMAKQGRIVYRARRIPEWLQLVLARN
jgi:predicted ABC-type ATPase